MVLAIAALSSIMQAPGLQLQDSALVKGYLLQPGLPCATLLQHEGQPLHGTWCCPPAPSTAGSAEACNSKFVLTCAGRGPLHAETPRNLS